VYAPISNWKNTQPGQSIGLKRYLEILDAALERAKYPTTKHRQSPVVSLGTLGKCGAVGREFDAGSSHRGGLITPECSMTLGHVGSHHDHVWHRWWG